MPFRITIDGQSWMDDDLTLDEASVIQKATARRWAFLNPLLDADDCRAMLAAFKARAVGQAEADRWAGDLTTRAALSMIEPVKESDLPDEYDDGIPKAGGATETTS